MEAITRVIQGEVYTLCTYQDDLMVNLIPTYTPVAYGGQLLGNDGRRVTITAIVSDNVEHVQGYAVGEESRAYSIYDFSVNHQLNWVILPVH
jgi:hypothetical protein